MEEPKENRPQRIYQSVETDWLGRTKIIHRVEDPSDQPEKLEQGHKPTDDHWYKRPVGIVALSATSALIVWGLTKLISHWLGI